MATILVIDDRAINREYLCTLLKYLNHQVIEAHSGEEGLQAVKKNDIDLIITDILMPHMDGYEFVRRVQKNPKLIHIPVIFYSATFRKAQAELLAKDLNVKFVLSKPAEPQTIIDTINKALKNTSTEIKYANLEEIPQSQTHFRSILYQAPQELKRIGKKLSDSVNQIKQTTEIEKLTKISENISQMLSHQHQISNNLYQLFELNMAMIAEQDPQRLLTLFCQGACKIINAEFVLGAFFDSNKGKLSYYATQGLALDLTMANKLISLSDPFIKEVMAHRGAFCINKPNDTQIPPLYCQPLKNIVAAPLLTNNQHLGMVYFVNKQGNTHFVEDDIKILDTLSFVVSLLYENIKLYNLIQKQAAKLQIEASRLKKSQDDLCKSETMFRQFAENIKDVFWRTSSSFDKVIYISPGYEEIWGRTRDSIYQNPRAWQEAIVEEDKILVKSSINKIIKERTNETIQFRIKRTDGSIRTIYNKTICLTDDKGRLNHVIGIASDITPYLQHQQCMLLEQKLRYILEKNESLIKAAPKLLKLVCTLFAWESGEFWLCDQEENVLKNIHVWHKNKESKAKIQRLGVDHDLPKKIVNTASLMWHKDALGIPLLFQNEVLGVMIFYSAQIPGADKDFIDILNMLGSRMGEFIEQKTTQEQLLKLAKQGAMRMMF